MATLSLVAGWIAVIFIGVLALVIVWKIAQDKIDIEKMLCEVGDGGKASLSRFQFLIFTFVIAIGLILIILHEGAFPDIPNGIFALLGISAGTYVVSKGIPK